MTKEQLQVKEWMETFGQESFEKPTSVDASVLKLRAKLILEEAFETITQGLGLEVYISTTGDEDHHLQIVEEDVRNKQVHFAFRQAKELDLVETADGLADLHYVAYAGTGLALGIDMEPVFAEVHRSNMSKLWTAEEIEARDSEALPHLKEITELEGKRRFIVGRADGKVIKSPSYSEADLKTVLDNQA